MIYNRPGLCSGQFEMADPSTYLTFESEEPFTLSAKSSIKTWDGTLEYSTNGVMWRTWDGTIAISSEVRSGKHVLYMRGSGNTVITGQTKDPEWELNGSGIRCVGNIETLLDWKMVQAGEHPPMAEWCFELLFNECNSLTTPPQLSATMLSLGCYYLMFRKCTNLITLPDLPAETLVTWCYRGMFAFCAGIKLSETKTGNYTREYRIPTAGTGAKKDVDTTYGGDQLGNMFDSTGGTFTGTPEINTTYYLDVSGGEG